MMTHEALKPIRLRKGDCVGITAPASCFDREAFQKGVERIKDLGFRVKIPGAVSCRLRYLAGSDEHRAKAFMECWSDPEVKAVLCARGGYGSMRILPALDFQAMKKAPKIFVGFSDISALLNTVNQKCNLAVFHGPVATSLAENRGDAQSLFNALARSSPPVLAAPTPEVIFPGTAQGAVAGGNLSTITGLAGTPWRPDFKGKILFLEDVGEAPYRIDRMLFQMKRAGMLDGIKGLALGDFAGCGDWPQIKPVLEDAFRDMEIPVISGFPAGHGPVNQTFPMGVEARLDSQAGTLEFLEAATRE